MDPFYQKPHLPTLNIKSNGTLPPRPEHLIFLLLFSPIQRKLDIVYTWRSLSAASESLVHPPSPAKRCQAHVRSIAGR